MTEIGDIEYRKVDGTTGTLSDHAGDVVLVVNVASKRGLEPTDDPDVLWNVEKSLIGRDGEVVARYAPTVTPDDPALVTAVDAALAR